MNIESILKEYKKQERAGLARVEKEEFTLGELNKNLKDGVCLELLRIWLGFGVGNKKTKLKDSRKAKTESRKRDHIKAMLNSVERYWIKICPQLNDAMNDDFKKFISGYHKNLYSIWIS